MHLGSWADCHNPRFLNSRVRGEGRQARKGERGDKGEKGNKGNKGNRGGKGNKPEGATRVTGPFGRM